MRILGPQVDLKAKGSSVEQALRELKIAMDLDIQKVKSSRYYVSPAEARRQRKKEKRANVRKYNKHNNYLNK